MSPFDAGYGNSDTPSIRANTALKRGTSRDERLIGHCSSMGEKSSCRSIRVCCILNIRFLKRDWPLPRAAFANLIPLRAYISITEKALRDYASDKCVGFILSPTDQICYYYTL